MKYFEIFTCDILNFFCYIWFPWNYDNKNLRLFLSMLEDLYKKGKMWKKRWYLDSQIIAKRKNMVWNWLIDMKFWIMISESEHQKFCTLHL
jgi:hypothetical protein